MRRYLRRLTSVSYGFLFVLWLYLSTTWRFWHWRIQFSFQHSHRIESTSIDMKQRLLFIRHGQSTWNAEELLPGQLPGIPLDEKGREQAALLADALAPLPISAIISSPLERALQTAVVLAQAKGLDVQLEPDLIDTDVGRWAGQSYKELGKIDPEWKTYVKDPTVAPEGVETFPQVQRRAVAAVERWRKQDNIGAYPAFVAHADIVKLLIAHYTGLDAGRAGTLVIENASVSIVEWDGEHRPRVIAISWSPRPGWLKPPIEEPKEKDEQPKGSVQ